MLWGLPDDKVVFPHPLTADQEGILAIGGRLASPNILLAYRYGIFPWFSAEDPLLWWFTHPRSILQPKEIRVSKSMRKVLRDMTWSVTFNRAFNQVIRNCQQIKRQHQETTWIQEDIIKAYILLHHEGYAHSVEVWDDKTLIGGLYGLSIGKVFYGESMFAKTSNASKVALISLARQLDHLGYSLIDCQQETDHLNSLGAQNIPADVFLNHLRRNVLFCLKHGDHHFHPTV